MNNPKLSDKIGQFVSIPNSTVKLLPLIGSDALALFVYFRFRTNGKTGNAFPAYDTIQKDTGFNRRKIAKTIRVLMDAGLIIRRRRFGQSTIYTLTLPSRSISSKIATNDKKPISSETAPIISSETAPIISSYGDPLTRLNEQDRSNKTKRARSKKTRDPLLDHAAVIAFKDTMRLTPNEVQREEIARRVGDNGHLQHWKDTLSAYQLAGKNKYNVGYMLDIFEGKASIGPIKSHPVGGATQDQDIEAEYQRLNPQRAGGQS